MIIPPSGPIEVSTSTLGFVCQATPDPVLRLCLLALSWLEGGDNPGARGDWTTDCVSFYTERDAPPGSWPTSFGLLQLHSSNGGCPPGLGNGFAIADMLDPGFNLAIGVRAIGPKLAQGQDPESAMGPWSTRVAAAQLVAQMLSRGISPDCGMPPPPGDGNGGSTFDVTAAAFAAGGLLLLAGAYLAFPR